MIRCLWEAEVGSTMWKMQRAGSDIDLVRFYATSTRQLLDGRITMSNSHESHGTEGETPFDAVSHEVGKLVHEYLRGNVNFVWAVWSPIVRISSPEMVKFRRIVAKDMSKNVVSSCIGLATSAVRDGERHPERTMKRNFQAVRTLRFARAWLRGRGPVFEPAMFYESLEKEFEAARRAFDESVLPSRMNEKPLRDWLFEIRMRELIGVDA